MTIGRKAALALVFLDAIGLIITFNVVGCVREIIEPRDPTFMPLIIPVLLLGIAVYLIDGYKVHTDMLSLDYASQHAIALLSAMLATLVITFVVFPSGFPLQQSRAVTLVSFALLIPISLIYRRLIYQRTHRNRHERSIIFVGDSESASTFKLQCQTAGMKQNIVIASTATNTTTPFLESAGEIIPFSEALSRVQQGTLEVEAIVMRESSREFNTEISHQLVDLYFKGVPTYTLELFHQRQWRKIPLYRLNQTWLFQEGFQIAREPVFERIKRISDVMLSLLGLIFSLPVLLAAGIAIKCDDHGSVFFKQTRIGRNRKPFQLYKLRTMTENTGGDLYAQQGDRRITRIGRFLRSSRLDELPQLLNVLRGEMSLIGPRAEWDRLVADYEKQIPCYHFRHLVRPGITGWAQVNYPYGANLDDTLRKLEYDLYYIRHFSFTLDASIVLKTIHVMLFGKGR